MSDMSVLSTVMLVLGTITAVGAFMFSIYKIAKRIDSAIGTDATGRTLSDRMERVEHQLWENGGDSLKDQVNKIEKGQTELKAEMGIIKDILLGTAAKPKRARLKKVE